MNILVTGIDGFVGSHLTEALLTLPDVSLYGIIEKNSSLFNIKHVASKAHLIECDILDAPSFDKVIASCKPNKIYHLAGQAFVPFSVRDPQLTFRVNINGGINLLEAVRKHAPDAAVLVVSSGEVYGSVDMKRLPIDESFLLNPSNPYAASKACIDLIAQQYRKSFGMNAIVVRPFNHLGPRQSELFVGSAFAKQIAEIKLKKREPKIFVGNLEPKRDFTDVKDVIRAYIKILDKPTEDGVFNVCSGKSVAIRDILDLLCNLSDTNIEIVPDLERQRTNDILDIVGSAARLNKVTGWSPVIPLSDTLSALLSYWKNKIAQLS